MTKSALMSIIYIETFKVCHVLEELILKI